MTTAITGGIAEGKSTVLSLIADMGLTIASADQLGRALFDDPALNVRLAEIVGTDFPIDRHTLRVAMLGRPELRRAVNRAMHGPIMDSVAQSGAEFVEVPLLFEACLQGAFNRVWVVSCGPQEQRRRLIARYGSEADVDSILATQLPSRVKVAFADLVIRTNLPVDNVKTIVSKAIESRLSVS